MSPIQVVWIAGELMRQGLPLGDLHLTPGETPEFILSQYCQMLCWQKEVTWPRGREIIQGQRMYCELQDEGGTKVIGFRIGDTVGQLLNAETEFAGPGHHVRLHLGGSILPDHVFLRPLRYVEEVKIKKQARKLGDQEVNIIIRSVDREEHFQVPWGSQLFELLKEFPEAAKCDCISQQSQETVSRGMRLFDDQTFILDSIFYAAGNYDELEEQDDFEPEHPDEWMELLPVDVVIMIKQVEEALNQADHLPIMNWHHGRGLDSMTIAVAGKAIVELLPEDRYRYVWFLDPQLARDYMTSEEGVASAAIQRYIQESELREIFVLCAVEQHWMTIHFRWTQDELLALVATASSGHIGEVAKQFLSIIQQGLNKPKLTVTVDNMLYQKKDSICGALSLIHLAYFAGLIQDMTYEAANDWYVTLRWGSRNFFRAEGDGKDELQDWLRQILPQKGVPSDQVESRAKDAISTLSHQALHRAKQSANPWKVMKTLTDKKGRTFRWVKEAELARQIEEKAEAKYGVEKQKKPAVPASGSNSKDEPLRIDPNQLWLKDGGFQDEHGKPVRQIFINEIRANGRGIAVLSAAEAKTYISEGRSISVDALALLTTSTIPRELQVCRPHQEMRFSAMYGGTHEPLILSGSLIQLGDIRVSKTISDSAPKLCTIKTMTIKMHYYRDQAQVDWQNFCRRPVSQLQSQIEQLQVCPGKACGTDCNKWHRDLEGTQDGPILDVWGWFFQKHEGGKSTAKEAGLFTVSLRVPWDLGVQLQQLGNVPGLYLEPRDDSGRRPLDIYRVVWIPKCSYEEAVVKLQVTPKALALCRLKDKYGLRTLAENEGDVYGIIYPDKEYINCKPTDVYQLEPLPFGMQKSGVIKLLKEMSWNGRPMHPKQTKQEGQAWLIAAQTAPPEPMISTSSGDIVITWVRSLEPKRPQVDSTIASIATRKHCAQHSTSSSDDPWLHDDPWAQYRDKTSWTPPTKANHHAMNSSDEALTKIEEVEVNLQRKLAQKIQETLPTLNENPATSARIDKIEVDMQELKQQNAQFSQWFRESAEKQNQLHGQIEAMQSAQTQQQGAIAALNLGVQQCQNEIHTQGEQQVALGHLIREVQQGLRSDIHQQTERLERAFTGKHARRE